MRASGGEVVVVDDVAAIGRQFDAAALLGRRRARLGELAGDAADLHHRRRRGISEHHRHLQEHAEKVADVVGAVLGEAFGAIAALQQESLAGRDLRQRFFQVARLACKNQRRKGRQLRLDIGQRLGVRIIRHLHDRLCAPGIGRPTVHHAHVRNPAMTDSLCSAAALYTAAPTATAQAWRPAESR